MRKKVLGAFFSLAPVQELEGRRPIELTIRPRKARPAACRLNSDLSPSSSPQDETFSMYLPLD